MAGMSLGIRLGLLYAVDHSLEAQHLGLFFREYVRHHGVSRDRIHERGRQYRGHVGEIFGRVGQPRVKPAVTHAHIS